MQNTLPIDTKTPNIWDFPQKLHSFSILRAEYSKNLGHLMQFFQKIGKFDIWYTKLTNFNTPVEGKLRKIGTFHNSNNFRVISAISYVVL